MRSWCNRPRASVDQTIEVALTLRSLSAASLNRIEHRASKLRGAGSSPAAVTRLEDEQQGYSSVIAGARCDLMRRVIATIPSTAPSPLAAQSITCAIRPGT